MPSHPGTRRSRTRTQAGKPTRTHATRSDPGEVAASTASETRRDDLPSNARRRPSHSMHFGAQSRGLRAPCERFAPWVTPGPRITRFRLAANLGRMGLDTHAGVRHHPVLAIIVFLWTLPDIRPAATEKVDVRQNNVEPGHVKKSRPSELE